MTVVYHFTKMSTEYIICDCGAKIPIRSKDNTVTCLECGEVYRRGRIIDVVKYWLSQLGRLLKR